MKKRGSLHDLPPGEHYEKRRIPRTAIPLQARVDVMLDGKVGWHANVSLGDVSALGAGFTLHRPIRRGRLILMTLPMPRQLRCFDYDEIQYKVWAAVRRCMKSQDAADYSIGVAFTGKHPPEGFFENPARLYDIVRSGPEDQLWGLVPADLISKARDDRKHTRHAMAETLIIKRVDQDGNILDSESTITENISVGGAAVLTTMRLENGAFVRVTSERLNITILSVVRNSRIGANGITRLHLEFIDRHFPLDGIEYS
jgi:hypothetical protein